MMPDAPLNDETVSALVHQFQRRRVEFQRERELEFRQIGTDALGRMFHDHFLVRDKTSFDALMRTMLTPAERDRVQTDRTFTHAWQIFVDLCWLRKRLTQVGIVVGVILFCLAVVVAVLWAMPYLVGPKTR